MRRPVVPGFESLNSARRAELTEHIFALVALIASRGWEPLTFNGQQRVKVGMAAAIYPNRNAGRRCDQINGAPPSLTVGLFGSKLENIPPLGKSSCAV